MAKTFTWDGVTYREPYEGPMRGEAPTDRPEFHVAAWNDNGGSRVSFAARATFEEAVAEIPALRQRDQEDGRTYDHWCVIRIERLARFTPMEIPGG